MNPRSNIAGRETNIISAAVTFLFTDIPFKPVATVQALTAIRAATTAAAAFAMGHLSGILTVTAVIFIVLQTMTVRDKSAGPQTETA